MKKHLLAILVLAAAPAAGAATAQTPKELAAMLPAIDGWTLSDKVETYNPDNLYDCIDGAADIFLACNFVEMTTLDYTKNGADKYITLQMYRHATPDDAFAIYSAERNPGPAFTFLKIGAEGYRADGLLYFLSGSMYVKLTSNDKDPATAAVMEKVARALAAKIDPAAAMPAMLDAFPPQDKQPQTEARVIDSFLGHKFMLPAWSATYSKDGKQYQLFIIDGKTKAGIEKLLADYAKFNKSAPPPAEGFFVMPDRFNGDIPMLWRGRHLLGVINDTGARVETEALLNQLAGAVARQARP